MQFWLNVYRFKVIPIKIPIFSQGKLNWFYILYEKSKYLKIVNILLKKNKVGRLTLLDIKT